MKREERLSCPANTKLSVEQQEKARKLAHIIIDKSTDFALVYVTEENNGGVSMVSSPLPIIENLTKVRNELKQMIINALEED